MKRRRRISKIDSGLLGLIIIVALPVMIGEWIAHLPEREKSALVAGAAVLLGGLTFGWWRRLRRGWRERRNYRRTLAAFQWHEEMSPREFEHRCADYLALKGWRSRNIGGPGDQGVDVLAEKDDIRLVLQCKKYGKPVGNRAVQEVFAAKAHARASAAAVVSNQGFTRGARELAAATGVMLLHFTELGAIDEILARSRPRD